MKFCKDCRHFLPAAKMPASGHYGRYDRQEHECAAFRDGFNLVTGERFLPCEYCRRENGPCGPDAKLFEPRQ